MTLSITTFNRTTFGVMTFSIAILSIVIKNATLSVTIKHSITALSTEVKNFNHNTMLSVIYINCYIKVYYAECRFAAFRYSECSGTFSFSVAFEE